MPGSEAALLTPLRPVRLKNEANAVLRTLAYFSLFQYPLSKREIRNFMDQAVSDEELQISLNQLRDHNQIFLHDGFYSLEDNQGLSERRKLGNARAAKLLPRAIRIGRFLGGFPFVEAIGISGSLSKNFADDKADLDFFIITKRSRLWIARTIMHLFKKLTYLTGHQHYFCMNYYIDEEALQIPDQNIFTSVEIATLIPVHGFAHYNEFLLTNNWVNNFLPNAIMGNCVAAPVSSNWFKRVTEWVFDNRVGEIIDDRLLSITTARWSRKHRKGIRNKNGHTLRLITGKHFSRSNPGSFQERLLLMYEAKLRDMDLV